MLMYSLFIANTGNVSKLYICNDDDVCVSTDVGQQADVYYDT